MVRTLQALIGAFALCVVFLGAASAQTGSQDLFTVSGVRVDVSAATAAAARDQAQDEAERIAFDRLVRRLSAPDQYARIGVPALHGVAFDRLVRSIEIEDERLAGARYIGRLRILFSPELVRLALREAGYSVLETRGPPILVAPQLVGAAPEAATQWRDAWSLAGFDRDLTPVALAPETLAGPPDWDAARDFAAAEGAASAVYVNARIAGTTIAADLIAVSARGAMSLGQFAVPMTIGSGGMAPAFRRLAEEANASIQSQWKAQLAQGAGERTRVAAQALFNSGSQWRNIKSALTAAGATIVADVLVEAIAREGALVSFSYVGAPEQLRAELARRGIRLEGAPGAWVLRADQAG